MKRNLIYLSLVLLLAVLVYYFSTSQGHVEDLGTLELVEKDSTKNYCVYQITGASPEAGRYYQNGDKVCMECRDGWPNNEINGVKYCYSRITFTASSGLVEYTAELYDDALKNCHECSDGNGYYQVP